MTRRRVIRWAGVAIALLLFAGLVLVIKPGYLWVNAWLHDRPVVDKLPAGHVDDASRLNRTHVTEVWPIPSDPATAEAGLRKLLERARSQGLRIAIAGARHSMGGHTIYPDGIVLDMLPFNRMELDRSTSGFSVSEPARAGLESFRYLDARGFSVAIMQSNDNFSVGGSLSVNCHGWQHDRQPIASTVESFRLMKADGSIVRCSREENAELFSLVLGGYGLFGVILDADLRVVPNERYQPETEVISADHTSRGSSRKCAGGPISAWSTGGCRSFPASRHFCARRS